MSRAARLTLTCLLATVIVGLSATFFLFLRADPTIRQPTAQLVAAALCFVPLTMVSLFVRFMRWQYILRRLGARISTIPSLAAWMGSFAFLPVPLYVAQMIARSRLLPPASRPDSQIITLAYMWERAFDVWSLAVLASIVMHPRLGAVVLAMTVLAIVPGIRARLFGAALKGATYCSRIFSPDEVTFDSQLLASSMRAPVVLVGAFSSVVAWGVITLPVGLLGWGAGVQPGLLALAGAAAYATLLGGLSLVPVGAGVAGFVFFGELQALGVDEGIATQIVFLFRVATAWLSVVLGGLALVSALDLRRQPPTHDHFDSIDACYDAWLPDHYRTHLVTKKTGPMLARVASLGQQPRGLDIGCGRGWYVREMQRGGAVVVGMDLSERQLAAAGDYLDRPTALVQGSVSGLPFRRHAFDFAYIINVMHHLPSPQHQELALRDIAYVVRPGGLVFLHEMNVRNLLFRWYLSYAFPILKGIEEGTEHYMDPRKLPVIPELKLSAVEYFTFTPDFVPPLMLPLFRSVESSLEGSRVAPYAAHFVAVLERTAHES